MDLDHEIPLYVNAVNGFTINCILSGYIPTFLRNANSQSVPVVHCGENFKNAPGQKRWDAFFPTCFIINKNAALKKKSE